MRASASVALATLLAAAALLAGCERPPVDVVQRGYRGTGMELVYNPRTLAEQAPLNEVPPLPDPASPEGPKAKQVFKNVQVLGDLSVGEFTRYMTAITAWVAPVEGCNYCHDPEALGEDKKYTKVVARRMILMTQHINADWQSHVAATGVTCFTCHRGKAVPLQMWFAPEPQNLRADFIGNRDGQNQAAATVGQTSLPYDPFTAYLLNDAVVGVGGPTALPTGHTASIVKTEQTYGLMIHMAQGLGVNCTFCHNTRNFATWEGSPPQRTTAWHGIRMARDLNNQYLVPLTSTFPANRLGPTGDVGKVNCATCHQGAYKPLYGVSMAQAFPEILALAQPRVAALPPPMSDAMKSVLYFGVGSSALEGEQAKGMARIIVTMSERPATKVTISGYHSASGQLAANQTLAKDRAFAVRDSLVSAGIDPKRVVLDKPLQTEANVAGEDPAARRVEVTVK